MSANVGFRPKQTFGSRGLLTCISTPVRASLDAVIDRHIQVRVGSGLRRYGYAHPFICSPVVPRNVDFRR